MENENVPEMNSTEKIKQWYASFNFDTSKYLDRLITNLIFDLQSRKEHRGMVENAKQGEIDFNMPTWIYDRDSCVYDSAREFESDMFVYLIKNVAKKTELTVSNPSVEVLKTYDSSGSQLSGEYVVVKCFYPFDCDANKIKKTVSDLKVESIKHILDNVRKELDTLQ